MFDNLLINVIEIIIVLTTILGFAALVGILVLAQRYLFIRKSKKKYLVLVIAFLISLTTCLALIPNSSQGVSQDRGRQYLDVGRDKPVGYLQIVNDKDDILAFGKFITGKGKEVNFYNVELKSNRADIKGLPENYDKELAKTVKESYYNFKECEEKTVSYEEMERLVKAGEKRYVSKLDLSFTLISIIILFLPFIITLKEYVALKKKEKIKLETIKSKISDI